MGALVSERLQLFEQRHLRDSNREQRLPVRNLRVWLLDGLGLHPLPSNLHEVLVRLLRRLLLQRRCELPLRQRRAKLLQPQDLERRLRRLELAHRLPLLAVRVAE